MLLLHHVLLEQEVLVGHQVVWMRGGPLLLHVKVRWHWAELRWQYASLPVSWQPGTLLMITLQRCGPVRLRMLQYLAAQAQRCCLITEYNLSMSSLPRLVIYLQVIIRLAQSTSSLCCTTAGLMYRLAGHFTLPPMMQHGQLQH